MRERTSILPPRWRSNTRSDQPTKRAVGNAFSRARQLILPTLLDFDGDLPERATLVAMQSGEMLEHEPCIGDDVENAGEAAGDLLGFDLENFWNLHAIRR